jgi:undecaprenyl-diphosphatase
MPLYQAIILAILQGLTEFLPISSTAHLIILPWLAGWEDPGKAFDVALHAGTLVAVLAYFWRTWIELALPGLGLHYPGTATVEELSARRRLFWYLVAATIPGALAGFALQHVVEEHLSAPVPIAIATIALGLVMWWADVRCRNGHQVMNVTFGDSMFIGVSQALALFPGVSRSGITITTGILRGLSRSAAARFSFLLATPIIAGAALYEVPKLMKSHRAGSMELSLSTLGIAILVSAVAGYAAISYLLRYLQTRSLKIFVVYRLVFGMLILLLAFLHFHAAR